MFIGTAGGFVVRDPEIKITPNGKQFVNLSIGAQSGYGDRKMTNWIRCTAWEGSPNFKFASEYCKKGDQVTVIGEQTVTIFVKQDGTSVPVIEIAMQSLHKANLAKEEGDAAGAGNGAAASVAFAENGGPRPAVRPATQQQQAVQQQRPAAGQGFQRGGQQQRPAARPAAAPPPAQEGETGGGPDLDDDGPF